MSTVATPRRTAVALRRVAVADLVVNRRNVREQLEDIDELAASIRANGLLQPLIVNEQGRNLVVTDGHRRLEACRRAGVPFVMCLVTAGADERAVTTTMLASAMHKQLRPLEQARAFQRLQDQGVTIADIARSTGYSVALIRARLLLLDLPAEAQDMVEYEHLTLRQATDLAKQVRAKKAGSTSVKVKKNPHFTSQHFLSGKVICFHHDTRRIVGGIGCGQCWEKAIRENERERIARESADRKPDGA